MASGAPRDRNPAGTGIVAGAFPRTHALYPDSSTVRPSPWSFPGPMLRSPCPVARRMTCRALAGASRDPPERGGVAWMGGNRGGYAYDDCIDADEAGNTP